MKRRALIAAYLGLSAAVILTLAGLTSSPASAQFGSGKPIRIIVPFGPAGSADRVDRDPEEHHVARPHARTLGRSRPGRGEPCGQRTS